MNGKPLIIDIAGKALKTGKSKEQRERECHEEIAPILKKHGCKFSVIVEATVEDRK